MQEIDATIKKCYNCSEALPQHAKYCLRCGQKHSKGLVTLPQLFAELVDAVFNIDSKLYRTLLHIFIPGKLTQEYFKGRQVRYVSPLRFFFFWGVVAFALMASLGGNLINLQQTMDSSSRLGKAYAEKFNVTFDSVASVLNQEIGINKSANILLDSLRHRLQVGKKDSSQLGYFLLKDGAFSPQSLVLSNADVFTLDAASIFKKYKVEGSLSRFQVQQGVKLIRDPEGYSKFVLGSFTWMLLVMLFAVALALKFIYIRRKRYYVEHLIFSMHCHAFTLMLIAIGLIFKVKEGAFWGAISLAVGLYLWLAMKRFYGQRWGKTTLKFFLATSAYLFIFVFALGITSLIGIALF